MRDDMIFLANPYLGGLQLAPPEPLSPSAPRSPGFNVQPRAVSPRMMGPVASTAEDDGFRPLAPADARMFLGRHYDPARSYRRNRLTGEIEPIGGPLHVKDGGQTMQAADGDKAAPSDRERLLKLGRGEPNHSPWNREPAGSPPATAGGPSSDGVERNYSSMPTQQLPPEGEAARPAQVRPMTACRAGA